MKPRTSEALLALVVVCTVVCAVAYWLDGGWNRLGPFIAGLGCMSWLTLAHAYKTEAAA